MSLHVNVWHMFRECILLFFTISQFLYSFFDVSVFANKSSKCFESDFIMIHHCDLNNF